MSTKILMKTCKKKLAALWFVGASIPFIILFFQTILGHYGNKGNEVWSWFLPNIMPTLSLIISVITMDTFGKSVETVHIDSFMFRFAFLLSAIYLTVITISILLQPFIPTSPFELMKESSLWLAPFQGLVSASIGAFFVKADNSQ